MWPLIRDFFTTKSAAVRTFRVLGTTFGALIASGKVPEVPEDWQWAGFILTALAAAVTQQTPKKEEPKS